MTRRLAVRRRRRTAPTSPTRPSPAASPRASPSGSTSTGSTTTISRCCGTRSASILSPSRTPEAGPARQGRGVRRHDLHRRLRRRARRRITTGWSRCTSSTPSTSWPDAAPRREPRDRRCRAPLQHPSGAAREGPALLYRLLDALSDSFFPAMDELDADIDRDRERAGRPRPATGCRARSSTLRRRVVALRRAVMPQRDRSRGSPPARSSSPASTRTPGATSATSRTT